MSNDEVTIYTHQCVACHKMFVSIYKAPDISIVNTDGHSVFPVCDDCVDIYNRIEGTYEG